MAGIIPAYVSRLRVVKLAVQTNNSATEKAKSMGSTRTTSKPCLILGRPVPIGIDLEAESIPSLITSAVAVN